MIRRITLMLLLLLGLSSLPVAAQETMEDIVSSYSIAGCRYWFDNSTQVTQASYANGKITLDVSALEEGFHTLHYQTLDSRGEVSPARTVSFFRIPSEDEQFKDYVIQTVRYWFDKDYTPKQTAYASGTSVIDVSSLEEGFHTLHYQVIDSKGETSPTRTVSFFRIPSEDEQFKDYVIQTVRYWFDKDYTPKETAYVSGTSAIDVSSLEEGFHTLHYQVIDSKGETSPTRTVSFFRIPSEDEQFKDYVIQTVRYWFDKDYTPKETAYVSGTSAIDVSALEEGFHTLHYQVIDSKGETSPTRTVSFFRIPSEDEQFKDYVIQTVRYWFDKDYTPKQTAYASGTSAIDVTALEEGFHTLHYQVIDSKGETSPTRTVSFFRIPSEDEQFKDYVIQTVRYWFDKDYTPKQTAYASGTSAIDVTALDEGDHTLYYQVINSRGETSPARSVSFSRVPLEEQLKVANVEFAQNGNVVTLSTTTEDATIHYTLSIDIEDEQTYTAPLTMTTDCVIEAWATREGYNDSDTTRYEFRYIPQGEATFDGLVVTVSGERTLDEAFRQVGGRSEAAKTIAAIIWNKDEALTPDDLQGIDNPNLLVYAKDRALVPYTVNNVVVDGMAKNLILTDNGTGNCNFYCPLSFTAQHATYSRDFSQRTQPGVSQGWETLALPFDVQEMRHATRGAIMPFGATGNGRHFWLRRQTAEGGLAQATGIEANRAYLISMPNSDSYDDSYNLAGRVTFSATDVTIPVTAVADSTGIGIRLTVAFQRIEPSPVVYAINRGEAYGGYAEGSVFVSGLREVRPFEAYTVHQDTTVPAPLYIPIDGESWLTDITQPSADMQPGTGQYYDLQGRRVAQPTKKGLYIVNGQKTIVR